MKGAKQHRETRHGPPLYRRNSCLRRDFVSNVDGLGQVAPHVAGSRHTPALTPALPITSIIASRHWINLSRPSSGAATFGHSISPYGLLTIATKLQ
jgi:hypothetical protein